jgi:hypothetical protein
LPELVALLTKGNPHAYSFTYSRDAICRTPKGIQKKPWYQYR